MGMKQVSDNCFAVLNEKSRVCEANSGLINRAVGVVIDTQSDLAQGGKATINSVPGKKLNNLGLGLTLGYKIKDKLGSTFGYKSTINDGAPDALRMN
jgi:hypothetical protein